MGGVKVSKKIFFIIPHKHVCHQLARTTPVDVRSGHRRARPEILADVFDTLMLLDVLLTVFFLPPRTGVGLLRPDERGWLYGGVPVGVGGLGDSLHAVRQRW